MISHAFEPLFIAAGFGYGRGDPSELGAKAEMRIMIMIISKSARATFALLGLSLSIIKQRTTTRDLVASIEFDPISHTGILHDLLRNRNQILFFVYHCLYV